MSSMFSFGGLADAACLGIFWDAGFGSIPKAVITNLKVLRRLDSGDAALAIRHIYPVLKSGIRPRLQ
jgi:hypothetical protein